MKKRILLFGLMLCLVLAVLPGVTAQAGESVSNRDDGVWLFPMDSSAYYTFTDWAGCPGGYNCPFHGVNHYGDGSHNWDGSTGHGHNGMDIGYNGDVYAAASGKLYCHNSNDSARGLYIIIEHDAGIDSSGQSWSYYSLYQHLSYINTSLDYSTLNRPVEVGTTIGHSGDTGADGSIHLHFAVMLSTSGRGSEFARSLDALYDVQYNRAWVRQPGFIEGEIVENPVFSGPAGTPGEGIYGVREALSVHQGSIRYTFEPSEVTVGGLVVTLNPNGGICDQQSVSVKNGDTIGTLPTPILNDDYIFSGWFTDRFGGDRVTSSTVVTDSMNLYAHWSRVRTYDLELDTRGGYIPDDARSYPINGFDIGRSAGCLVIYKQITNPDTNSYGAEIAVDYTGRIIAYRHYGDTSGLTVPDGGFIVSGHANGDGSPFSFIGDLYNDGYQYVGIDYETGTVTAYRNYAAYLVGKKYTGEYTYYGELPVPEKEGYWFEGWYTSQNNERVTADTSFRGLQLYAKWITASEAHPSAVRRYNNHTYELFDLNLTWLEANAFCEQRGGYLVTITDAVEQDEVLSLMNNCSLNTYCIGASDADGAWKWVTGESMDGYDNWDRDLPEPSNGENEAYAVIAGVADPPNIQPGEWAAVENDLRGKTGFYRGSSCGFICETEHVCEHEYTLTDLVQGKNVYPTFTEPGYLTFRCQNCGEEIVESYPVLNDTDYEIDVEREATCTRAGLSRYTYVGGGAMSCTFPADLLMIDHNYEAAEHPGTCDSYASVTYTCSMCGDSYTVITEDDWSEWSSVRPDDVPDDQLETKLQYRYSDRETTTGNSDTMSGWTLYDTGTEWSGYGDWSDWSTVAVSESESRQVETTTLYRYYYYYCPECGGHEPFTGKSDCYNYTLSGSDWHETWSPVAYDLSDWHTFSYTSNKYYTTSLGDGEIWCFSAGNEADHTPGTTDSGDSSTVVIDTGYRYRDRTQTTVYYFYRWSAWSEWSDWEYTEENDRRVETRTLYRCHTRPLGDHTWGEWAETTPATSELEGEETRVCTKCGETQTRPIPKLAQYTISYNANGGEDAPEAQTKNQGAELVLSEAVPSRSGYFFLGWAESSTATTAAYHPGGSYTADADTTLYAVWLAPDLVLPASLISIEAEAFAGGAFRYVKLQEATETIGNRAFADCQNLQFIYIPEATITIYPHAFDGVTGLTVIGTPGSIAEGFAYSKGYTFVAVED